MVHRAHSWFLGSPWIASVDIDPCLYSWNPHRTPVTHHDDDRVGSSSVIGRRVSCSTPSAPASLYEWSPFLHNQEPGHEASNREAQPDALDTKSFTDTSGSHIVVTREPTSPECTFLCPPESPVRSSAPPALSLSSMGSRSPPQRPGQPVVHGRVQTPLPAKGPLHWAPMPVPRAAPRPPACQVTA